MCATQPHSRDNRSSLAVETSADGGVMASVCAMARHTYNANSLLSAEVPAHAVDGSETKWRGVTREEWGDRKTKGDEFD